jgi:hypothetical protein
VCPAATPSSRNVWRPFEDLNKERILLIERCIAETGPSDQQHKLKERRRGEESQQHNIDAG